MTKSPTNDPTVRIPELEAEFKAFQRERERKVAGLPPEWVILDVVVNELPPSINQIYSTGKSGQRYKNSKADSFINNLGWTIKGKYGAFELPLDRPLTFFVLCHYASEKTFKDSDADNRVKVVQDALCNAASNWQPITRGKNKGKLAPPDDNVIHSAHGFKFLIKDAGLLSRYPQGFCRVVLAEYGYLGQVLSYLGLIKAA